jgi:predicted O-methyltransferase YrrM
MGGAGNMDLLYTLCDHLRATRVVETGVAYGWTSLAVLLSLQDRPGSLLYSVDLPYVDRRNEAWVGVVVPQELRPQWRLMRAADRQGLPVALREAGEVDVAHYDSDKSYEGRLFGYPLLWDSLRPGGILVSDDVGDNSGFRDFAASIDVEPVIVADGGKFQGILVKPGEMASTAGV